jgi:two-component system, sensor histidine kinase
MKPSRRTADNAVHPGRKVLLVEDNQVNQTVIEAMLSSLGYEVSLVSDGAQAIHFANTERIYSDPDGLQATNY